MPWKVSTHVSERLKLIARIEGGERIADLAREFGVSEKTAYKFWKRYQSSGPEGLLDRSRAPKRIPHRTPPEVIELIVELRRKNPSWGGRKLKVQAEKLHPGVRLPSPAAITLWLTKAGLVKPRPRRFKSALASSGLTTALEPNDVWGADFKGQFRLGDASLCYPITASDLFSRFLLGCEALEDTRAQPAWLAFEELFDEFGLPRVIRTDNGAPFASSQGLAGLTTLSAKWLRLGIRHERITPGKPQQNGSHERMHRTLKAETTRPAGANFLQQQERFERFKTKFNLERPHEAIGMKCPGDLYRRSERAYRGLPELEYPLHDDVRVVGRPGWLRLYNHHKVYLTEALVGERVGIRELEDGRWLITYATLDLGYYDPETKRLEQIP